MGLKEDAKEVLSEKDYASLVSLNEKARNFETTTEEEAELSRLIDKARNAVARREKTKQLSFLKNGDFTIAEVLSTMKATKKAINKAVSELFKTNTSETIGIYDLDGRKVEYMNGERIDAELAKRFKEGGVPYFISGLTSSGKSYLTKPKIVSGGPYNGQTKYDGIRYTANRLGFNKDELMKALELK